MSSRSQSAVNMVVFVDAVVNLLARQLRPDALKRELDVLFDSHGLEGSSARNEVLLLCAERAAQFLSGLPEIFAVDRDQGAEAMEELRVVLEESPLPKIQPLIDEGAAAQELLTLSTREAKTDNVTGHIPLPLPVSATAEALVPGNGHGGDNGHNGAPPACVGVTALPVPVA